MVDDYLQFSIRCCDELLQFLVEMEHDANPFITANFQGDAVVTKKVVCLADLEHGTIVYSKKYNRTFIVGPKRDRWFLLCLYGNTTDMEITIGIDIPSYCRDELVCTIKDNWDNWLK
jgi:hypothetical protein